jgi:hypothetical protein
MELSIKAQALHSLPAVSYRSPLNSSWLFSVFLSKKKKTPPLPTIYLKSLQNKAILHQQKADIAGWLWRFLQAEQKSLVSKLRSIITN